MDENRVAIGMFVGPEAAPMFYKAQGFFSAALEHSGGRWTTEHILSDVVRGLKVLFIAWEPPDEEPKSAIVAAIQSMGGVHELHVEFGGGDLTLFKEQYPRLEGWALEMGCEQIRVTGRRGWVRALKDLGFAELWVSVVKPIGSKH